MAAVFHSHLDNYPTSLLSANRGTTRNPLSRWDNTGKDWENESEDTKMKETVKTSRTAGYLEKIFRALNVKYFNGELEEPIITIQSTPRAYGHVTVAKAWQRADGGARHELNIGAGTLDTAHRKRGGDHPPRVCTLVEPSKRHTGLQQGRRIPQQKI